MSIHIHAPAGTYVGQIRRKGARRWEEVCDDSPNAKSAMIAAIEAMTDHHNKARVIYSVEYYDPTVVMELKK